jgi:phosphatidylserine synthase
MEYSFGSFCSYFKAIIACLIYFISEAVKISQVNSLATESQNDTFYGPQINTP